MLQTCTTELSELCERLAREFHLKGKKKGKKNVFQAETYQLVHALYGVNGEEISYADKISGFSANENEALTYIIKGRFLSGRSITLRNAKTNLGTVVAVLLENSAKSQRTPEKELEVCEFKTRVNYLDTINLYKFIVAHIRED